MEQGVQLPEKHAGAMAYLASALNERPDLDWIYQTACEGLARVLSIETTFIVLYEDTGQSYLPVWALHQWRPANLSTVFLLFLRPPSRRVF